MSNLLTSCGKKTHLIGLRRTSDIGVLLNDPVEIAAVRYQRFRKIASPNPGFNNKPGSNNFVGMAVTGGGYATATITVASNTFTSRAILRIGPYTITSGVDYTVGGDLATTASNMATAIAALYGVSTTYVALAESFTVRVPEGVLPHGGTGINLKAEYRGAVTNFTITGTTNGYLSNNTPAVTISPPTIIPY